jgi:hypothetical protein
VAAGGRRRQLVGDGRARPNEAGGSGSLRQMRERELERGPGAGVGKKSYFQWPTNFRWPN